ncbi:circadian clock-controlled protein daywake [Bactrocera oleae]|uniref:circadian clock-controlled protein daywake n=1 Tax=Bactrocera oleae TaxID=104688 RepID=UPI00387ED6B8
MCSISIWCTLVALCAVLSSTYGSSSVATNCAAGATCPISGSSTTTSTTSATTGKSTENIHNDSNNNKRIFLKEKPKELQTCQRKSADFDKCIVNAYQNIFSTWKNGIDGVPHSTPIDPLFVEEFEVIEDRENITPIAVKINNITVTGLSEAKVKSVNFKDNEYDFKMTYLVPKIRLNGHYTAKGHVLLLKLDTSGEMFMEILEGLYTVTTKVKLNTLENHKFFNLKALQFNVDSIKDLNLHFDNLFKDKVLNENTNAVFNDSWRVFFDIFKPKIEAEINKVLLAHFRSVFAQVPAEFFIADVATAAVATAEHETTPSTVHSGNIKDITHLELQQAPAAHSSSKAEEKAHKLH